MTQPVRRRWFARLTWATAIVLFVMAYADFLVFQEREQRIQGVVNELDGKSGSIGGWPFGRERVIVFKRPLNDDELRRIADLAPIHQSGRHYFRVHFRNCDFPDQRLAEMKRILQPIPLSVAGSERQ